MRQMQDATPPDRLHPCYTNFDGSVSNIRHTALTLHQVTRTSATQPWLYTKWLPFFGTSEET